jgi:hypothetical protein
VVQVATSLFNPGKQVPIGQRQRFDDWCLRVMNVAYENAPRTPKSQADHVLAAITVEVSNRGRGRAQREPGTVLYDQGRTYRQSSQAQAGYERTHGPTSLLTSMSPAGGSIMFKQLCEIKADAWRRSSSLSSRRFHDRQ